MQRKVRCIEERNRVAKGKKERRQPPSLPSLSGKILIALAVDGLFGLQVEEAGIKANLNRCVQCFDENQTVEQNTQIPESLALFEKYHGTEKIHDFSQCTQIVFLCNCFFCFEVIP